MPDKPIVTIKLRSVSIDTGDGPDTRIKIQATDGPAITRIGAATQDRFLFQKPFESKSLKLDIDVKEVDPVYTESISSDKTITLSLSDLPKKGSDNKSVTLAAVGGDEGKTATFDFSFDWFASTNVEDVVDFIKEKMTTNLTSSDFTKIKAAKDLSDQLSKNALMMYYSAEAQQSSAIATGSEDAEALLRFTLKVKQGADWDYKATIQSRFGDWALDAPRGRKYKFDIWANIHYGFIGKAIGFSDDMLLDAAGIAQAKQDGKWSQLLGALKNGTGRELDESGDGAAIIIGIGLWKKFGSSVTRQNIIDAIRGANASRIHSEPADEGVPPKSFLP